MFKNIKKLAAIGVIASILVANVGVVAFAAVDPAPKAVVTGGSLGIADLGVADFTPATLDGTTKIINATVTPVTLTDATGTGNGWSVTLKASKITNATAKNIALNTLSDDSLVLGTVSVAAVGDSTPITNIVTTTGAINNDLGIEVLKAGTNEGMGKYTISMEPMALTLLPKEAKAGTYTSTLTVTLTSGPAA